MFNKIVVPVDGSEPSNAAVDLALRIAAEIKIPIAFVHAVELSRIAALSGPSSIDPSIAIDAACQAGEAILKEAKEKAAAAGVSATSELMQDECVRSVLGAVRQSKADLIVVGSHGRSGIARALLGSVAEGILRHSSVPVMVCHAPAHPHESTLKREARVAEHTVL